MENKNQQVSKSKSEKSNQENFKFFEPAKELINSPLSKFEFPENDSFATDPKLCERAFNKLCELWNKNPKSRNFVTHLCAAFTPYNSFNKVLMFDCEKKLNFDAETIEYPKDFHAEECAILGIKVAGLRRIASEKTKLTFKRLSIEMESSADTLSESQKTRIHQLFKELPIEVRTNSFAYFSDKSDKHISSAAMTALLRFIQEMILRDCPELRYAINKNRIQIINSEVPKEKRLNPKQVNKVAKASTFNITNHLDNGTIAALKGLKAAFEESEK